MKRSEMIREINWALYGLFASTEEYARQIRAEEILKSIEEAGMMPPMTPEFEKSLTVNMNDIVGDHFSWEPEDE